MNVPIYHKKTLSILFFSLLSHHFTRASSSQFYSPSFVREEDGRDSFEWLSSGKMWQENPLDYLLFLNANDQCSLIRGISRTEAQKELPDCINHLIASYITYEKSYPKDRFEQLERGAQLIEKNFLSKIYIKEWQIPRSAHNKIKKGSRIQDPYGLGRETYCYKLSDVLRYLLQGKTFEPKPFCALFCCWHSKRSSKKETQKIRLPTYEEVKSKGWEDEFFVEIKLSMEVPSFLVKMGKNNVPKAHRGKYREWHKRFRSTELKEAMEFYLAPQYQTYREVFQECGKFNAQ